LYIGDGMSAASLVSADDLATLLESLRTRQVPVHSYIVGPNRDLNLLGILGTHSGGLVQFDQHANTPAAGLALAGALAVSPVYPTTLELDGSNATLIPGEPLPLRPDRDTVYLGRGDLPSGTSLRVQLAAQSQVWNVAPTA